MMASAKRILMVASEVESLARTGGLGDVVEALSAALADLGHHVVVVTPRYEVSRVPQRTLRWPGRILLDLPAGSTRGISVTELPITRSPSGGTRRVCLVEDGPLFDRAGLYGDAHGEFGDNALRFAVLSRAALEIGARVWNGGPDVVHAHDWHAALAVLYARLGRAPRPARVVFTIHNLAFQGEFAPQVLARLGVPGHAFSPGILGHHGSANLLKGATALADRITTVSPTYAREILSEAGGFGLDQHLRAHAARLEGIRNGIDTERFDPNVDPALAARYDASAFREGRAKCKRALEALVGFAPEEGPIFGCVGRLTWQKGVDLLVPLVDELVRRGARLVIVGQGERDLEQRLTHAARVHPGRVAVRLAFDPPLSRRVYAGSDFFVVPSRFEPCGLTQMYAMRYGAIPIVTDLGGLHDTVDPDTGILAQRAEVHSVAMALARALVVYGDREAREQRIARGMAKDFSWEAPARAYARLYEVDAPATA